MAIVKYNSTSKKSAYLLFCMSILSVPINIEFFQIIRITDILFIFSVIVYATSNIEIKRSYIIIFSLYFCILLFSSIVSMLHNNSIRYTGVVFYYKYSLIFIIPLIVIKVVNNRKRLKHVVKILYYVFMILVIWVYVYNILLHENIVRGSYRVSFPFSNLNVSDAHVYSSYLVFTLVAYLEYIRKILNHSEKYSTIIFVFSLLALILTGSKTGIVIMFIYSIITIIITKKTFSISKVRNILLTLVIMIIPLIYILQDSDYNRTILPLYNRSIAYAIPGSVYLDEASIYTRYVYLINALEEITPNLLLIGNGPIGSKQMWYDGGISILLAHGGILGLCVLITYIYILFLKSRRMANAVNLFDLRKVFTLLLFIYVLLCIIAEHFLLTRNLLPIATMLSVIYVNIKLNYIDLNVTGALYEKQKLTRSLIKKL